MKRVLDFILQTKYYGFVVISLNSVSRHIHIQLTVECLSQFTLLNSLKRIRNYEEHFFGEAEVPLSLFLKFTQE